MSFLGDALAHGVLPGIALAFIIGVDTTIGAFIAAMAMVGGINVIRSHSPLPEDTSIGVLFVGFLALAVAIMSSSSGSYSGDLNRFLFGSITGVDAGDLRNQAIAAAISLGGVALFYRAFLVMTFDHAQARGARPSAPPRPRRPAGPAGHLDHRVVRGRGNLLVFAFLIAPPATAVLLVRRVPRIMVTAAALGTASAVVGLLASYHYDTAAGATMALATVVVFLGVLTIQAMLRAIGSRHRHSHAAVSGS